jgi:hypothetical protein
MVIFNGFPLFFHEKTRFPQWTMGQQQNFNFNKERDSTWKESKWNQPSHNVLSVPDFFKA